MLAIISPEVWAAIIGSIALISTSLIGWWRSHHLQKEKIQAEAEMKFQRAVLNFEEFIGEWGSISEELEYLMETTNIDRFLILRAWNGHLEPKWTTSVYQLRRGIKQEPISYVHFELDAHYVDQLRHILTGGSTIIKTDTLEPCNIKSVYEMENVKEALWIYINSQKIDGGGGTAITYCSFASLEGELDNNTITKCNLISGRLKGLSSSFFESRQAIC